MIRCLLISPVAPPDPDNGDAQFTRDLLADPPAHVEFVPYTEALARGELAWGPSLRRELHPAAAARAGLHVLRAAGALLPDPVRWLRVTGSFDVVHVHCMPVRFLGARPPLVASDSAGTWWYWTAARGLAPRRVTRLLRRERRLARALGYLHPSARPEAAARLLLFVEAGRALVGRRDAVVCPPGVPSPRAAAAGDGRTLLFVARDFRTKGGDTAVAVLERLRRTRPDTRLVVAGAPGPDPRIDGVSWLGPRTREELYRDVYPRADLFLYPTRFDCAPLVVMEALAHGLPVVAPRAFALPELVRDGETGFLFEPGDEEGAAAAVEKLLAEPALRAEMAAAAEADFEARLSAARRNALLEEIYAEAAA